MWLNKGESVRWKSPWGSIDRAVLEDEGQTLTTDVRLNRVFLINGLFYGVEGMRVGGREPSESRLILATESEGYRALSRRTLC